MELALPYAEHLENVILGAAMLHTDALVDAVAALEPRDFYLDSHQRIFRTIVSLHSAGEHVDSSTVRERLAKSKELDSIGGYAYLLSLENGIPYNFNVESYCRVVKDKALARELYAFHNQGQLDASDPSDDTRTLIEQASERLRELLDDQTQDIQHVGEYLVEPEKMFEKLATVSGIDFGYQDLDEMIGGAQPGDLIVIAARPSMGKSALACCMNWNISSRGKTSVLFSLEQKRSSVIRRMLSSAARIDYKLIRDNTLREWDKQLLIGQIQALASLPLYIDDTPSQTATRIRSKCERLRRRVGLDIAFIDQLSHVSMKDCREKEFRLKVGEQTKMFKRMALEMNIPVVVFNQLKRGDDEPKLSDLKESGNIEEDADVVIFPHRPEYYDRNNQSLHGLGQFIVAKNREGATGTIDCTFQGRIMRWGD